MQELAGTLIVSHGGRRDDQRHVRVSVYRVDVLEYMIHEH